MHEKTSLDNSFLHEKTYLNALILHEKTYCCAYAKLSLSNFYSHKLRHLHLQFGRRLRRFHRLAGRGAGYAAFAAIPARLGGPGYPRCCHWYRRCSATVVFPVCAGVWRSVGDGGCRSIPPIKRHTEFLYAAGLRPSAIVILASSTTAITA